MASLRLCSQIKTNGQKCGSPALRHHTLCYFHYQWQRRDQRRIRLGGPIGTNKNPGIELPLLDGPAAILVSIMEIQRGLLDQRIPIKMGTALLYSLQLALQARIPYSGLSAREPVRECPELDMELEMERAKAMRPAKEKCAACPKQDDCLSPRNCRKLPKLPAGHRRDGDRIVRDTDDAFTQPCHPEVASPNPCHPERSAVVSRAVEGPYVSSPEATNRRPSPTADTTTKFPPTGAPHLPQLADVGSADARPQSVPPEEKQTVLRLRDSRRSALDGTSKTGAIPHADNILGLKTKDLIDLLRKFPQLAEIKREQNQGVGVKR